MNPGPSSSPLRSPAGSWVAVASKGFKNCFWLLVPVLLLNLLCARYLPGRYQPEVFWSDIPRWIAWPENVLRGVVLTVPVLMPLSVRGRLQRVGLVVYLAGTALYFASWWALIVAPESAWGRGAIGFMAPAWTPALWLAGLTLLGDRLFFARVPYRRWMYAVLAAGFLLFHNLHAALVFSRG